MPLINGVTLLLTFLSNIFFLVGCIGFSSDKNTIKNVSWFYYKDDSNAWFGLQKFYVDIDLAPYLVMKETVAYSSDSCGGTYCDECDRDGKGAFGLLIIALIFTVFSLLLNGASTASPSAPVQMGNAFTALVAFVASLVSISLFMVSNGWYSLLMDCFSIESRDAICKRPPITDVCLISKH